MSANSKGFAQVATQIARRAGVVVPLAAAGLMPFLMSSTALAACSGPGTSFIDCTAGFPTGVPAQTAAGPDQTGATTEWVRLLSGNVGVPAGMVLI